MTFHCLGECGRFGIALFVAFWFVVVLDVTPLRGLSAIAVSYFLAFVLELLLLRYGDNVDNTVEENASVFCLI